MTNISENDYCSHIRRIVDYGKSTWVLLSVAHDMSGLGSTRSVRYFGPFGWGWNAPDRSPSGCANDQVPGYFWSVRGLGVQPVGSSGAFGSWRADISALVSALR